MSGKIKGITIEFDGNTTKLGNALKNIENKSKETTKSLREIEKSLKFNPGNAELVEQQQRKLKEAIENTQSKLKTLKEADEQAKQQLANGKLGQEAYDELQREIIKTKNNLESYTKKLNLSKSEQTSLKNNILALKDRLKETGKTTEDLSKIMGSDFVEALERGEGSSKEVKRAIDLLSGTMELARGSSERLGEGFEGLNNASEVFDKITDAAKKIVGSISEAWSEIDKALDTITAKTGASGDTMEDLKQQYKDVYSTMAVDSKAVGDAISELNTQFGLQGDKLEDATKLLLKYTEINGVDVTNSTQQAKKAIEQFNLKGEDLGKVLDSITKTGQDTGVSVDALFDKVIQGSPTLQNLGLGFKESVVLMGQFEKSGLDSQKVLGMLTKAQGIAAKEGKSLKDVLAEFTEKAKTSTDQMELLEEANRLFGTKGGDVMLKAVQEGKIGLDDLIASASEADGTITRTYDNMLDPSDRLTVAQNNLKIAMADVGDTVQKALAPVLEKVVGVIQDVVQWFTNLDPGIKTAIVTIGGLVAGITAVLTIIGILKAAFLAALPVLGAIKTVFLGFGGVLKGLFAFVAANPIVLIIGAVIGAVILVIKHWDKVKAITIAIWNSIVTFLKNIIDGLKNWIGNVFNSISTTASNIWNGIKTTISNIWEGIKTAISIPIEFIKTTISNVWDGIKSTTETVWEGIKTAISIPIEFIKTTIENIWNGIKTTISDTWEGVKSTTETVWEGIKTAVSTPIEFIKTTIEDIWSGIKSTTETVWEGIKTAITGPIEKAKEIVSGIIEGIKKLFSFEFDIPTPHFSIEGSWNPIDWISEGIPSISVDWYKEGGIFDKPSVIGVGEAGQEAVLPTHKLDKFLEDSVNRVLKGTKSTAETNTTINNFNVSKLVVREEADIKRIAEELYRLQNQKARAIGVL